MSRLTKALAGYVALLARLRQVAARGEQLLRERSITKGDCELLIEGAFITATGALEGMLETLFVEFTAERRGHRAGTYALLTPRNRSAFLPILYEGRSYQDYLPYKDKALKLAARFLKDGRPFSSLPEDERSVLAHAVKIRNAIANSSDHAYAEFVRGVPGVAGLPTNRKAPGVLLRAVYRAAPVETWLTHYFAHFEGVVRFLHAEWTT